jgi:hypothetical protein
VASAASPEASTTADLVKRKDVKRKDIGDLHEQRANTDRLDPFVGWIFGSVHRQHVPCHAHRATDMVW